MSRSRYWGIPLPIWRTADASEEICIGSVSQLQEAIAHANEILGTKQEVPEDLHRPYIDRIVLASSKGEPMHRELDLIDVWFDSGSMPYAQWHYPFEHQEEFANHFPADFIAEGVDQTRGWFFTLHAIAVMAFDSVAFRNVVSNGLVLDKDGRKMSKRLGNVVEPFETIAKYGADATRWYLITNGQPWDNLKFDSNGIEEVQRKFFGTLFNTYSFFSLYANIDGFCYAEAEIPKDQRPEIDVWILSLLQDLISRVTAYYEDYEPTYAARTIQEFVGEELSNWYVRLCRRRFWKGDYSHDKLCAYQTLYNCLETVAQLMAPIAPFFADWLWCNLNGVTRRSERTSVHLTLLPQPDEQWREPALEQCMQYAQKISSLVLSLRKRENIRVRQPLRRILVPVVHAGFDQMIEDVKYLILSEVNVKEIELIDDAKGLVTKSAKPNFRLLGKRLGDRMKESTPVIMALTNDQIGRLEQDGQLAVPLPGFDEFVLQLDEVIITSQDIPGWQIASDGELTVALDTHVDDQLLAEGTARELVNRIQNLRKSRDLAVTDRIVLYIEKHDVIVPAVEYFGRYIKDEVLADQILMKDQVQAERIDLLDGVQVAIDLQRV